MLVELHSRGRIRPRLATDPPPVPDTRPAIDLLGLRDDAGYLEYLARHWGDEATPAQVRVWLDKGVPSLLRDAAIAAQDAEGGRIPYSRLAELLERVQYRGPGIRAGEQIAVPSLDVLAAWSLTRAVQRGDVHLQVCEGCGSLFYGNDRRGYRYCDRPSPGQAVTCKQKAAYERFHEERGDWNRHYRAAYARMQRGSIPPRAFELWRDANSPDATESPVSFPEWIGRKRTAAAREAAQLTREWIAAREREAAERKEEQ